MGVNPLIRISRWSKLRQDLYSDKEYGRIFTLQTNDTNGNGTTKGKQRWITITNNKKNRKTQNIYLLDKDYNQQMKKLYELVLTLKMMKNELIVTKRSHWFYFFD